MPEPPGKFKASAYSLELVTELRRTFDILDYPSGRKSTTQEPPEGRGAEGPAPPHLAGGLSQLLQGSPNPNCFQSSPFGFYGGIKM